MEKGSLSSICPGRPVCQTSTTSPQCHINASLTLGKAWIVAPARNWLHPGASTCSATRPIALCMSAKLTEVPAAKVSRTTAGVTVPTSVTAIEHSSVPSSLTSLCSTSQTAAWRPQGGGSLGAFSTIRDMGPRGTIMGAVPMGFSAGGGGAAGRSRPIWPDNRKGRGTVGLSGRAAGTRPAPRVRAPVLRGLVFVDFCAAGRATSRLWACVRALTRHMSRYLSPVITRLFFAGAE
mmetsp:Transcript_50830/g.111278  ORF Transcript_50830/g.111278 Transcript_50830/m.111278 type:complete len:235 (+) Transcript_50830:642-1346(+)